MYTLTLTTQHCLQILKKIQESDKLSYKEGQHYTTERHRKVSKILVGRGKPFKRGDCKKIPIIVKEKKKNSMREVYKKATIFPWREKIP